MVFESKKTFVLISLAMVLICIAVVLSIVPNLRSKKSPDKKEIVSAAEIKNQFSSFANNKEEGFSSTDIQDSQKKVANLDTVSKDLNFQIYAPLNEVALKDSYQFFSCTSNDQRKYYGLLLNVTLKEDGIKQLMKSWESQLLKDLHTVLYPGINFSDDVLNKPLVFQDGLSRYAPVSLPDNSQGSLNYKVVNASVFISSSIDCLTQGSDTLFDP